MAKKEKTLSFFNISCVLRVVLHVVLHVCCMCVACRVAWQVYILPQPPRPPRLAVTELQMSQAFRTIGAMAAASSSSVLPLVSSL